MEWLS